MIYLIIGLIIVFILIFINIYNGIIKANQKVTEAYFDIDVALSKRYQTISQVVEVVKGYAKHEKDIFEQVTKLRSNMSIKELETVDNKLSAYQQHLLMVAESYPDLKANQNFLQLQKTIVDVEDHLSASRRLYNANVAYYNEKIQIFPNNILANFMKLTNADYFKINEAEKENATISI